MFFGPTYCMPMSPCGYGHSSRYADTMAAWSSINCGLASVVSFIDAKNNGVPTGPAIAQFAGNMANGLNRNLIAAEMQRHGNPMGNLINAAAGYGNPYSNFVGTTALMSACSPAMFWGCMPYMPPIIPMGMGCWGGGFPCGGFYC